MSLSVTGDKEFLLSGHEALAPETGQRSLDGGVLGLVAHSIAVPVSLDLVDLGNDGEGRWPFFAGGFMLRDHALRVTSTFGGWRSIQLSYGCISVAYAVLTRISCKCGTMDADLASA
jgi:hypothetical protein